MNRALIRYRLERFAELSDRQQKVARTYVESGSRQQTARLLFLEESTVRCHLRTIYHKLGIGGGKPFRPSMELGTTLAWADGYAVAMEEKWAAA